MLMQREKVTPSCDEQLNA